MVMLASDMLLIDELELAEVNLFDELKIELFRLVLLLLLDECNEMMCDDIR